MTSRTLPLIAFTITLLACAGMAQAQQDALIADDGQYLGCVRCSAFHPDSIRNPYGRYGSKFSHDSINNTYGPYGSPFSQKSARNPYTQSAPRVHNTYNLRDGALSANPYHNLHLSIVDPILWKGVNNDLQIIPDDSLDASDDYSIRNWD